MGVSARWVAGSVVGAVVTSMVLSGCVNRFATGWIPYWETSDGQAAVGDDGNAELLSEVSLMWHEADDLGDGTVDLMASASSINATVATIRSQGLPVIPAIIDGNDSGDKGRMLAIFADPLKRANHVQKIVDLVMTQNYDGIDIDYESFPWLDGFSKYNATHSPNWIAFVHELGDALHARGKVLSVTVPPVYNGGASGYTFYAQQQIGPFVDRLRLMVYDWSVSSPGPISPMSWVNSVIAYSDPIVPNSRLQLGVPTYGRHWRTQKVANELCPDGALGVDGLTMQASGNLFTQVANSYGQFPVRDASGELRLTWTQSVTGPRTKPLTPPTFPPPNNTIDEVEDPIGPGGLQPALRVGVPPSIVTCTVQHTVFVPDAQTVKDHALAAVNAGWSGITMWAIGYEVPAVFDQLASIAPQRPNGAPSGVLDPVADGIGVLRVTGQSVHPEFDLPVAVRLTVTPTVGAPIVRTVTARANRAGMAAGLGPFHGFDETFNLAAGSYQVCASVVLWGGAAGPAIGCDTAVVTAAI